MAKLEAVALSKSYHEKKVVKNISFSIEHEVVGLLGPNGAGKTTSFYLICGIVQPDSGQILLDGTDITHLPLYKRADQGLGYLPQESSIFRHLTVAQNILAILELRKDLDKAARLQHLDQLLEEFNITALRDVPAVRLSGGERRRVEIARALAKNPQFILLDEPFAGIDPISVIDIKQIITHLKNRGIGVLITDHNVRETLDICHKAYIVNAGEIFATGTPQEILNNRKVRKIYLGESFHL